MAPSKTAAAVPVGAPRLLIVAYTIAYYQFNNQTLGKFISQRVNHVDRGNFRIAVAHFPYFGGLFSVLLNTPAHVVGLDYTLHDPDGNLVIEVPYVESDVHLQELVVSLVKYAATQRFHLNLHFANGRIPRGLAVIAPTRSTWGSEHPEINIVAAMSAKVKTPPSGGEFRIQVDSLTVEDVHFGLGYSDTEGKVSFYGKFAEAQARAALVYSSKIELETAAGPYFFFRISRSRRPRPSCGWATSCSRSKTWRRSSSAPTATSGRTSCSVRWPSPSAPT